MAQKTEKLSQELIDDLRGMQTKANELVIGIGQAHLKLRNFKTEITRIMEEQKSMEKNKKINTLISNIICDIQGVCSCN